jgi:hypothetical protein
MSVNRKRRRGWRHITVVLTLLGGIIASSPAGAAPDPGQLSAAILSSSANYVSGGDLRVSVDVPQTVPLHQVDVFVNGAPADADLVAVEGERRLEGIVSGLPLGASTIEFRPNGNGRGRPAPAILQVTNYPIAGPMFSGPHQQPFYCQTAENGLGAPLDANCFAETQVTFQYASTDGTFKPLPAGQRPGDLRTTTTTEGVTVDYIVRLETGVINRAVYQTAILYDPSVADTDSPQATPGWNERLVYSYGGGCNAAYAQGVGNGGVMSDLHLSRGFATASSTLNVLNNNCNDVLSAETTSMVKERFIETYGVDVHTIGWGGSGGAISQYLVAHNYPGLLDGIIPTYNYPDATSIFSGIGDCRLMFEYMNSAPAGMWDVASQTAVSGHGYWNNCLAWAFSFANRLDSTAGCNPVVPPATIFDPVTNPGGVRCAVADDAVNVLGPDPTSGFAPTPANNRGVQYGLDSVNSAAISVEQFLDLNSNIGGFDTNGQVVGSRIEPSSIIGRFYETGRVTTGAGLATTPIINIRAYTDDLSDIHTRYYTFNTRARLMRDNGTAANQIVQIVGIATPPAVLVQAQVDALLDMDQWLGNISSDTLVRTAAEVIAAKPAQTVDKCWDSAGNAIVEPVSYDAGNACNALYPVFGDPRVEAGAPISGDVLACALKPVDAADYSVTFTPDEWTALLAAFPQGVCDYSQPGIGQGTWAGPWQSFGS